MRIISLLVIFIFISSCTEDDNTYTRSECISKTELLFDRDISEKKWIEINNHFYTIKHELYINQTLDILIPSVNLPLSSNVNNHPYMFSQYDSDCKNKNKNLDKFLQIIKSKIPEFPDYVITDDVVQPSGKTISVNGPYWRDGCEWINNKCLDKIPRDEIYEELKEREKINN